MVLGASGSFPHNLCVNSELVAPASFARRRSAGYGKTSCLPAYSSFPGVQASTSAVAKANIRFHPLPLPDPGYTSALAAANRFLQAWQNQDHETGLLMLTDAAKQNSSRIALEVFFSSGHDAAYEIARGKKLKAGSLRIPGHAVHIGGRHRASRRSSAEIADRGGSRRQRRVGHR